MGTQQKKCGDLTDTDVYKIGTEPKTVVSSLIQLLGKRQHRNWEQSPRRS